jgi:glycosidase
MQWDGSPQAGFTGGLPWLPMAPDAQRRNVAAQLGQRGSLLEFYRALLQIRQTSVALREGEYSVVPTGPGLFAFLRQTAAARMLVIGNMAAESRAFAPQGGQPLTPEAWQVVLGSDRSPGVVDLEHLRLDPFEALLLGPA